MLPRVVQRWLFATAFVMSASLATAAQPSAIFVMNADGSNARLLTRVFGYTEHAAPRWSHDGERVAFDAIPQGESVRRLWVIGADGQGRKMVGQGSMPCWSPDDKQFAFHLWPGSGKAKLFVTNVDGDGRTQLAEPNYNAPRWSRDGSKVLVSDLKNLIVFDQVTGETTHLFDAPVAEVFKGFDWSPDNRQAAVIVRAEPGAMPELRVISFNAVGEVQGTRTRMTADLIGTVSFSPDGKRLAGAAEDKLFLMDVEGDGPPRFVPGQRGKCRDPHWSPDGKRIVFASDREGK